MAPARRRARPPRRPHRPAEIGPRTFRRGRWYWIDLRPFGGDRAPIRNPKHANWPAAGDRTTDAETAKRWSWAYLDHLRVDAKRRHLGLRGPAKPLGEEALRYLAHRGRTSATKTFLSSRAVLTVQLVPFLGAELATDAVDQAAMQRWVDGLLAKRYKVSTIRSYLAAARTFFRWRTDGAHDPTRGVQLPDPGERDVEPWTDDELTALREAADALDVEEHATGPARVLRSYRLLLELALGTGCRLAELAALEWRAIDAAERTVRVRWQIPPDGYGTELQPLKGRRNRTALILPSWWAFHDAAATKGAKGRTRVLVADGVASVSHRAVERYFDRLIAKAELKRTGQNAHQARHAYARIALDMGARLEELQRFLGHASIRTTEKYYGWMTGQSATTLARSRIYGEGLTLVKPKRPAAAPEARRAAGQGRSRAT